MLLEEGKEYEIMKVVIYPKFGDDCFYIIKNNKKAYASCHFSVTYFNE